jgi:hypothetical protein
MTKGEAKGIGRKSRDAADLEQGTNTVAFSHMGDDDRRSRMRVSLHRSGSLQLDTFSQPI